ncbi:hydrolase [Weissella oryzae SG25]|uniref:Hydrolase n=1 Tax=Weissella oryzae (strain DSM 25784 / JCM 18191 / LMG 30913 / SG25) TaxID=1329250 RepID=A0A069CS45_WEIOS|nr:HD domain-containing protein [Weissella oryzae]GAK30058.1 hydrolase [Weissella oryzae SG25]
MIAIETKQLVQLTEFMEHQLGQDKSGHGDDHVKRVVNLAEHILTTEPTADSFITLAAATLHDNYDDKLFTDPSVAKAKTAEFMTEIEIEPAKQIAIFKIIDNMSWSKQRFGQAETLDINGQIVQDADRLEAIGAISIARVIQYGVKKGHPLYDPMMAPRDLQDKAAYRSDKGETVINHFYEKLFLLKDYMNTAEGKRIALQRDTLMHNFVDAFEAEWAGVDFL